MRGRAPEREIGAHAAGILALCVLGAAIYANTLSVPFVFDDSQNIAANRYIRLTRLGWSELRDAALKSPSPRPVANLSFALNYYVGGYELAGYHLVNIAVHLVNGILVYLVASILLQRGHAAAEPSRGRRSRSRSPPVAAMSLVAAAIFVAHPVQTQSVTYIVQRMNSLAAMFYLLALLLFLRGRLGPAGRRRWGLWSLSVLCWLLALGSKQVAATLPLVVWLCEWYFFRDLSREWLERNLKFALGAIAVLVALALVYLGANPFDRLSAGYAMRDFGAAERVLTQLRVVVFYIGLLVLPLPSRLNLLHPFATSRSLLDPPTTLLALIALLALLVLAIRLARRQRLASFCILWFFLHLAIESSFIPLEMVFEHRLYLPMFGFALLFAQLPQWLPLRRRGVAGVACVLLIAALAAAAHTRNRIWRDPVTLWSDVIAENPNRHRPHNNLALALERRGRTEEAIRHYTEALRLKPDVAEVHSNLGRLLGQLGRLDEAARHLEEALRVEPDSVAAHNNLGNVLREQGRQGEAIHHLSEAVRLDPGFAEGHYNLALALVAQRELDDAIRHYSEAVRLRPDFAEAHNNLGLALAGQGKLDEAMGRYSEALRLRPDFAEAHNNLGVALARRGRLEEAVLHYSAALKIDPDYAIAHNNLGVARARQDRVGDAISSFSAALRIDPEYREAQKNLQQALRLVATRHGEAAGSQPARGSGRAGAPGSP